jgi:hypothetical protein
LIFIQEKECKSPEKSVKDNETQYNWLELKEESLAQEWLLNNDKKVSIADQVTEAAESAMIQTGFIYEETTGLYYDYNSGYYYDSVRVKLNTSVMYISLIYFYIF